MAFQLLMAIARLRQRSDLWGVEIDQSMLLSTLASFESLFRQLAPHY